MILLIDSYDSFTNNLARLLTHTTGKRVVTVHNDAFAPAQYRRVLDTYIPHFDYVVVGPGPGHPANAADVGIGAWLIRHQRDAADATPILGICLGFQSICHEFGATVGRLASVKHGQVYTVQPTRASDLFPSAEPFASVRYHSLCVDAASLAATELEPVAFCRDSATEVVMAVRHARLPLCGVQYHPESVCSQQGQQLVRSFDAIAARWRAPRAASASLVAEMLQFEVEREGLQTGPAAGPDAASGSDAEGGGADTSVLPGAGDTSILPGAGDTSILPGAGAGAVWCRKPRLPHATPVGLCSHLRARHTPFVLLNSAAAPANFSIIGLPIAGQSEVITHSAGDPRVSIGAYGAAAANFELEGSIWALLGRKFAQNYTARSRFRAIHSRELPFMGGYMGLISYEEGQHVVVEAGNTPDLKLVFIERFVVFDHATREWLVVSTNRTRDDAAWCADFAADLEAHELAEDAAPRSVAELAGGAIAIETPSRQVYNRQFAQCQEHLHAGDSYELCLTTQSRVSLPRHVSAWDVYRVLARRNAAPFSCYMEFDDVVLLSSSPERFVSWRDDPTATPKAAMPTAATPKAAGSVAPGSTAPATPPPSALGPTKLVELRPIKGTVKKTAATTLASAKALLQTPKEMGENLMIVDLIRHDLHKFIDHVSVDQLMAVEEYQTVYQMVSVIRGRLAPMSPFRGIDILHESLPPGSMTGAPKRRSVELLQRIEAMQPTAMPGGRRGVYSGVAGYWSVTDDADWSVVIRSAFHYPHDPLNTAATRLWRIGAGGAITVLSDVDAEWDEMEVKLASALQAFR
ncbi:aminodeoxychorismate synthase [[Candida] zeylanoides]